MNSKEPIVIFSSCDANYIKHIPTLLMSIHEFMSLYEVHFFFLYHNIDRQLIEKVQKLSESIHIKFEAIQIDDASMEKYRELKQLASIESTFPVEGYYIALPNIHLPLYVKRALYLDAGDVILSGDICDYYFSNFEGNILTVSKGFSNDWSYSAEEIYDRSSYLQMGSEYFNSGSVLFNVELMRRLNINFDYYASMMRLVRSVHDGYNWNTFGGGKRYVVQDDQGMLGISFPGYIQFFDPENKGNINTTYNFRPFVLECNKSRIENVESLSFQGLEPKIIHLIGNKPGTSKEKRQELLKISQECLALWDVFERRAKEIMEDLQ